MAPPSGIEPEPTALQAVVQTDYTRAALIVIPSKHVAILWNGPWHYKEMPLSNHSLAQVQNRDRIKIHLFESMGWKVFVFEDRHFSPQSAFDHLAQYICS